MGKGSKAQESIHVLPPGWTFEANFHHFHVKSPQVAQLYSNKNHHLHASVGQMPLGTCTGTQRSIVSKVREKTNLSTSYEELGHQINDLSREDPMGSRKVRADKAPKHLQCPKPPNKLSLISDPEIPHNRYRQVRN